MNSGPLIFFGILVALASSFWSLLVAPQVQIGVQQTVTIEATGDVYPAPRPGLAQQGADVYRSLGCAECHSQQVRQTGVNFEVWLADAGTNRPALAGSMARLKVPDADAKRVMDQAPARIVGGLSQAEAMAMASQLTNDDAKAQAVLSTLGPDIQRGWGRRTTVAQDYLGDYPVQLGSMRLGPDLANYGAGWRFPGAAVALMHLYAPQKSMSGAQDMKGSMMPPFRFLFTKRRLNEGEKAALPIEPGYDLVPSADAEALVAYLASLKADVSLPEAPTPAPPSKPAPAAAAPATASVQ